RNTTVEGPDQVRARVNQDPTLSGQMTLWNQQGSRLIRGNLLVIPIAQSLLYVEPFFLAAERSSLPELRQVAVVTKDHLGAAPTFAEAMSKVFPGVTIPGVQLAQAVQGTPGGQSGSTPPSQGTESQAQPQAQQSPQAAANAQAAPGTQPTPAAAAAPADVGGLTRQARQLLSDYGRLTAEGKYKEAGDKLSQLKQTLDDLAKRSGG
ncbi:MAG TPA: hypothetical protein VEZ90_14090, partial [Blastocatellia bacterium]|nr:hypothetical protein [Blastocatellia bacterium]